MGGGYWNKNDFVKYSRTRGRRVTLDGRIDISMVRDAREMYTNGYLADELDPKNVMRECCDSEEHPETIPVILALDVTGSMGNSLIKTAASLNEIMQHALREFKDVEFMIMGIGDLYYDKAPIQISQFESDVRIARHLDKIWFERGGGGNTSESYSAAWYMGLLHTSLDCWKRGKKGIIITLGDEPLNPNLPARRLHQVTGDDLNRSIQIFRHGSFIKLRAMTSDRILIRERFIWLQLRNSISSTSQWTMPATATIYIRTILQGRSVRCSGTDSAFPRSTVFRQQSSAA